MWRPRTLRVRFALWVAGLLLVVLAIFSVFVYVSLARGLAVSIDDSLVISSAQAVGAINVENGGVSFADAIPGTTAEQLRERGLTIRVLDPAGRLLEAYGPYRGLPVDPASVAAGRQRRSAFATLVDPSTGDAIRFYSTPIVENDHLMGIMQVAQTLDDKHESLERLLAALLVSVPFLVGIAAIGGYLLARRALAPIDAITRTARRISAEDLHARLGLPATDDEVGRLAATFDEMIARLDRAFQRERRFTADAAHELRTPLAAMQMILSVTRVERRPPEEYEQAFDDVTDEANRLRSLTEGLLQLARGDARQGMAGERIDVSMLVGDVADALLPLAEAKGLNLTCAMPPNLAVSGDRDNLIRLFVNLIENGIKYTECGRIVIRGDAVEGNLRVRIADTGMGIGTEHLPRIFDRFYRVESARTSAGSGLGLAIAQEIAHAHRGTIEVQSAEGVGTTFTVTLPLLPCVSDRAEQPAR